MARVKRFLLCRVEESERVRERQKSENQKDGEETQRLQQLHQLEQRMEEERQAEMKRYMVHAHTVGPQQSRLTAIVSHVLQHTSVLL